jgi:hypothetical protein
MCHINLRMDTPIVEKMHGQPKGNVNGLMRFHDFEIVNPEGTNISGRYPAIGKLRLCRRRRDDGTNAGELSAICIKRIAF